MRARVQRVYGVATVTLEADTPHEKAQLTKLRHAFENKERRVEGRGIRGDSWLQFRLLPDNNLEADR